MRNLRLQVFRAYKETKILLSQREKGMKKPSQEPSFPGLEQNVNAYDKTSTDSLKARIYYILSIGTLKYRATPSPFKFFKAGDAFLLNRETYQVRNK